MRFTLTTCAVLTVLTTAAHAELMPSQSLTTSAQDSTLVSGALARDDAAQQATTARDSSTTTSDNSSVLDRLSSVASDTVRRFKQNGIASFYGHQFNGHKTANGERFDMNAMTAAHRSLPLSCYIRVTNKDNGKSVVVKVNDRGPYVGNRILDLSYGAAQKLGIVSKGTGNVTIERVSSPD